MSVQPTFEQIVAVVQRAVAASGEAVRAVIAHGSWVRQDFWPPIDGQGQRSDVDLIVVGNETCVPDGTAGRLQTDLTLGLKLDAWRISERELRAIRDQRAPGQPVRPVKNGIFDINGFDLVAHHQLVWGEPSSDPLHDFPVPRGEDLARIAVTRLCDLKAEFVDPRFQRELNRVACDALKAAALFFVIRAGRPPTRNKNQIFQLFLQFVPDFPNRVETATAIWRLYQDGQREARGSDAESRGRFVEALAEALQQHAFR